MENSSGSSPLARGLPSQRQGADAGGGIIPARAGFTHPRARGHRRLPDHPRSRGVYTPPPPAQGTPPGSSPLARGLPKNLYDQALAAGIIPARAGFTFRESGRSGGRRDHPRSRGVYPISVAPRPGECGSSPLARGLPADRSVRGLPERIIPARAGFTRRRPGARRWGRDHPRSRGVYRTLRWPCGWPAGSSPLARGLHLRILGIPTNP